MRANNPRTRLGLADDADSTSVRSHSVLLLPEDPLIRIRPGRRWELADIHELWAHKDLFYFLVWRDLKTRYKQTVLGALWVILQPLLMTLIFVVFLGLVVHVPTDRVPYPLFVYSALLCWTFFSNAISSSSYSVVANSHLITKVYFPRILIPASAVVVRLFDFLIASVMLLILFLYYRISVGWSIFFAPLIILSLTLLALAVGLWFSCLNVKYRDIGTLIPVLLQLWMFISPIIYPSSLVPTRWRAIYKLNPLAGIIENFRAALFGLPLSYSSLVISVLISFAFLFASALLFWWMEDDFADVV